MFGAYSFEVRHYMAATKAFLFNGKTIPVLMIGAGVILLLHATRKPDTHRNEPANGNA